MSGTPDVLADEYQTLVGECTSDSEVDSVKWNALARSLCESGEWTPRAAAELIAMAKQYGAFMLRNAHALAVALEIEDGEWGF